MIITPLRSFVISGRVDLIGAARFDDQQNFSSSSIIIRVNSGRDKQSKFRLTIQDLHLFNNCQNMLGKYVYAECELVGTNYFKLQEIGFEPIYITQSLIDKIVFMRAFDADCKDDFLYKTCLEALKDKIDNVLNQSEEKSQVINFTLQKKQKKEGKNVKKY